MNTFNFLKREFKIEQQTGGTTCFSRDSKKNRI